MFVLNSASDPEAGLDLHGSALILLSWIQNQIRVENADPDPGPRARKLTKGPSKTDFRPFKKVF
jgi:hypothetical protein